MVVQIFHFLLENLCGHFIQLLFQIQNQYITLHVRLLYHTFTSLFLFCFIFLFFCFFFSDSFFRFTFPISFSLYINYHRKTFSATVKLYIFFYLFCEKLTDNIHIFHPDNLVIQHMVPAFAPFHQPVQFLHRRCGNARKILPDRIHLLSRVPH